MKIEELREKHPRLLKDAYPECGPGWFHRLDLLLTDLEKAIALDPKAQDFSAAQIKEKFGGLRCYFDGGNDKITELVKVAEKASYVTCEKCGHPGSLRRGSWWQTLCDTCHRAGHEG